MPKKKAKARPRAKAKSPGGKMEFECDVCGTTFVATDKGVSCMEDIICCGQPMKKKASKPKSKAKKARKKSRR